MIRTLLFSIASIVMLSVLAPPSAEAGCRSNGNPHKGQGTPVKRVGWRAVHPFGGNGVPLLRRLRGC